MATTTHDADVIKARWIVLNPSARRGGGRWAVKVPSSDWIWLPGTWDEDTPEDHLLGGAVRLFGHQAIKGMRVVKVHGP